MTDCALVCVNPDRVKDFWPYVVTLLESAMLTGQGDQDLDGLYAQLQQQESLLWIVWSDAHGLMACGTTRIIVTAHDKVLELTSCGGHHIDEWKQLVSQLERFAIDEGCRRIRAYGRHGWKAILPDYSQPWIALEKVLN